MKKHLLAALVLGWVAAVGVWAQTEPLLVPPADVPQAGKLVKLKLYLNNPASETAEFVLPEAMTAVVLSTNEQRTIPVSPLGGTRPGTLLKVSPMSFATLELAVMLPDTLEGTVSLRVVEPRSNPVMFAVKRADVVRASPVAKRRAERGVELAPDSLEQTTEIEDTQRHISAHEPIYFAVGPRVRTNAKFQFSFKYRMFAQNGNASEWWRDGYFSYTQTSLWDLESLSAPFYDTSYKPSLFYLRENVAWKPEWLDRLGWQAGVQHESNGKSDPDSRSLNTAFITPQLGWVWGRNWKLHLAPRFIAYLDKEENPDLTRYRGYVELFFRLGQEKGFQLLGTLRPGSGNQFGSGSLQLDATWPMNRVIGFPETAGGYLQLQWFTGYGESLLSYDVRVQDQIRLGLMIVR